MLVACTPIYTPHMDSKGVVEGSEQHWERGKHVLSQDKDCLKAPHEIPGQILYAQN